MDTRRELQLNRKQLDVYHRKVGENVLWAAYDPSHTVIDNVYNEPGTRVYTTPVEVQTLWINLTEGGKRLDDERYDVRDHLNLAVSVEALRNAGIPDIFDDPIRVFDIFQYWSRSWAIVDYEILGRFRQEDSSTIAILASEIDLPGDYPFEPNTFAGTQVPSLGNAVNTLRHGFGPPPNTLGIDGDFYVDLSQTAAITMYGPKGQITLGVWPTPPTIVGIYTFTQTTPATTWTIVHNLGHFPAGVSVRLSSGANIEPSRVDVDVNTTVLTFSGPYSGTAELM